jgi:hypothetical protein
VKNRQTGKCGKNWKTDDGQAWKQQDGNNGTSDPTLALHPFTLIFENDSTAVPAVGRPIKSAG